MNGVNPPVWMHRTRSLNNRKQALLTLDQLFTGLQRWHFLLPQHSNSSSVRLPKPHFRINYPRSESMFAISTKCLCLKMTTALV